MDLIMDCPVCGSSQTLRKRVNAEHDEVWVCDVCPAVLFTYWYPEQIHRLYSVLGATPAAAE